MPNVAKDRQIALGRAIRLRREELGISQQDLGLEVGYDQGWISHIENGHANPAYGTADRIARALAWPLSRCSRRVGGDRRSQAPQPAATPDTTVKLTRAHR